MLLDKTGLGRQKSKHIPSFSTCISNCARACATPETSIRPEGDVSIQTTIPGDNRKNGRF